MNIQFTCRNRDCGAVNEIGREWAGQLASCYACGASNRVPGSIPRTSRVKIVARWWAYPIVILSFYAFFWSWVCPWDAVLAWMLGGIGALAIFTFVCWAIMNIYLWFISPQAYRLMKKGGGDPFFDTLPELFNPDPPEVRFQEWRREQERQEGRE
jgi:hypothetical protein